MALLIAAGVAFVVGTAVRRELHTPPGGHEQLMERFAARGIERVHVDTDTLITGENAWGTYYGPRAQWVTRPPWRTRADDAQAYVTGVIWPTELQPIDGVEILHAPGVSAVVGSLERAPWGHAALRELLDSPGQLTFEAEHLPSQREDVVRVDPHASGGLAVAAGARPVGRPREPFMLSHGPGVRLDRGRYLVDFMVRVHCRGLVERTAVELQVLADARSVGRVEVECRDQGPDYEPATVPFNLSRASRLELRVKYLFGEVWFDRAELRRDG